MEQDSLELELGTQFKGIEEAKAYAAALNSVARAETRAAKAVREATDAMKAMPPVSSLPTPVAIGPQRQKAPLPMGPNQRLLKAGDDFDRAKAEGTTAQIADAHYALRRAQNHAEQAQRGAMSPMAQALYSTRVNLPGGAAPLLGKTLEGMLGKEKAIAAIERFSTGIIPMLSKAGPIGLFASATVSLAQKLYDLADASAKATNALTDQQAQAGGNIGDVARLGLMGADPGRARGFSERISSDPLAMAAAGSVGIANMKSPYGDLNFSKKYLDAIERVSKIGDESLRRRLAITLGIEEEVARYSLLSERTRQGIKDTASQTGFVNDPAAQRAAAEFKASQDRLSQSLGNFSNAVGQLFMGDIANLLDDGTMLFGTLSTLTKQYREILRTGIYTLLELSPNPIIQMLGRTAGTVGNRDSKSSPLDTNNQLLAQNNQALQRLTQNIGESNRSREATDRFRTFNSASQFSGQMRSLFAFGVLG